VLNGRKCRTQRRSGPLDPKYIAIPGSNLGPAPEAVIQSSTLMLRRLGIAMALQKIMHSIFEV
jgi:hypothetical protein